MNEFQIENLGPCKFKSPLTCSNFVADTKAILSSPVVTTPNSDLYTSPPSSHFQKAGPREFLHFDPQHTTVGILTCGGLCPGMNSVIRSLVMCLSYRYGTNQILGFRYGFAGLNPDNDYEPVNLKVDQVKDIHHFGGTILGTSRGPQPLEKMVDYLKSLKVDILFCIGGDGTLKGARAIGEKAKASGYVMSIIGIPKTVDNDILFLEKTFGFDTAVEMAQASILAVHEEARAHINGIGIVKLMGRDSGFIALYSAIASSDVNCLLIPEKGFKVDKLVQAIKTRFKSGKNHYVIVVAEGAGQEMCNATKEFDASGNVKLVDIGVWLLDQLSVGLKRENIKPTIKYIDPSYTIRSAKTNSQDAILTVSLAQMAVHAGMAGKTNIVVGLVQNEFCHIPLSAAVSRRKIVDVDGELYRTFLDNSGMPDLS